MASNGRLPASDLARVKGNGWLERDAAAAFNAMAAAAARDGVDLAVWEGAMRRTYRPYSAQLMARSYWCGQGKCGNAAVPGTSNHGWGLAVDLMSAVQRRWIDMHGAFYGFAKRWSDAPGEWWHIKWRAGVWHHAAPKPNPLHWLTKDERFLVQRLTYHRQRLVAEAKTGKGPKYQENLRWARWYKAQVQKQMGRIVAAYRKNRDWSVLHRGIRYQVLKKAIENKL